MKKLLMPLALLALFFVACNPDDGSDDPNGEDSTDVNEAPTAPENYTQKAVLEYFSGAWCGWCPDGAYYAQRFESQFGGSKFYQVVVHRADAMENQDGLNLISQFGVSGYPTGMINRIGNEAESRSNWEAKLVQVYDLDAPLGLAVDATATEGDVTTVKVDIGVGGSDLSGNSYKIVVYALADLITSEGDGFDQVNYIYQHPSFNASHPYYNRMDYTKTVNGNTYAYIRGYEHTNTLIDVLNPTVYGEKIDEEAYTAGSITTMEFTYQKTDWEVISDISFVAFVYENNLAANTNMIINAQKVSKGEKQDWD